MAMSALPLCTLARTLSKDITENSTFTPSFFPIALANSMSAPTKVSLPLTNDLNSNGANSDSVATTIFLFSLIVFVLTP